LGGDVLGRYVGRKNITGAGRQLDDLPTVVGKRATDFPDALEEAVLADVNVRPDRFINSCLLRTLPGLATNRRSISKVLGRSLIVLPSGARNSARC
jgi:hypothetical protein